MQAVYEVVMEFYDRKKPWKQDFVKFTIEFDEQGRVAAITYTPFPVEHKDALLERVRDVCQPFATGHSQLSAFQSQALNSSYSFRTIFQNIANYQGKIWRRGWDSNPRMMVLQTIPLGHLGTAPLLLCPKSMPNSMPNAPRFRLFTPNHTSLSY
jgi:hypothetical protein